MVVSASAQPGVRDDLLEAARITTTISLAQGSVPAATSLPESALAELLYTVWFTRSGSTRRTTDLARTNRRLSADAPLVSQLRAVHAATRSFEGGWIARAVSRQGLIVAVRGAMVRSVIPPDYINLTRPAAPVRVGDSLAVTERRDEIDATKAWWVTFSTAGPAPATGLMRVYWNCPAESICELIAMITQALRSLGIEYTLKCPTSEFLFDRVEPVVLYLPIGQWSIAKNALRHIHQVLGAHLRDEVPPFTLRLGHGVAAAEDPANGLSFGQSRANAVAAGLVTAQRRRATDAEIVVKEVLRSLVEHGISPLNPYLGAGSPHDLITAW